ncbi:MAG: hypothetical protein HN383_17390 [Verrucomicrobia bacterium]|jgi:hypothetical protein|nr:hypothetical protein [Verrucomicrobiota bacterium]
MAKFEKGDWVQKGKRRGIVCGKNGRQLVVRWLGRDRGERVGAKALKSAPTPWVLGMEGSLDSDLTSTRSAEKVLRTWLGAENVQAAYKTVHCLEDVRIIGRAIGPVPPLLVYISCHGNHDGKRPYLTLGPSTRKSDHVYLDDDETVEVFGEAFPGMHILLSACNLGKYGQPIGQFRRKAGLGKIAVYTRGIYDSESMLFDLMVFHGMLSKHWTFTTAIERAVVAMNAIGVKGGTGRGQKFVKVF